MSARDRLGWPASLRLASLAVVVASLALARTADAHPLDVGYLRVEQTAARITVSLDVHVNAVSALLGGPVLDAAGVASRAQAIATATLERAPITAAGQGCRWGRATASLTERTVKVSTTATCRSAGPREWTFPFVRDPAMSPRFQLLIREAVGTTDRLATIESPSKVLALAAPPAASHRNRLLTLLLAAGALGLAPVLLALRRRR